MSKLDTKFNDDQTVTIWDIYNKKWHTTEYPSTELLATLGDTERQRVIEHCGISPVFEVTTDADQAAGNTWMRIAADSPAAAADACETHAVDYFAGSDDPTEHIGEPVTVIVVDTAGKEHRFQRQYA